MARYFYENVVILVGFTALLCLSACTNPSQPPAKQSENRLSMQNNKSCIQLGHQHYKVMHDSVYQQDSSQQWQYIQSLSEVSTCVKRGKRHSEVAYFSKGIDYSVSPTEVWVLQAIDSLFWGDFLIVQAQNPSKWVDFQDSVVLVLGANPLVKNPSQMDLFFPVKEVLAPAHTYDFLINSYIAVNTANISKQDTFVGVLKYLHQPYTTPASTFLYNGFYLTKVNPMHSK
ncbi:VHS/ENTH/ANTH domain-containing protein [Aureispira anguillae]|uniref:Lipoprotein n=1 Tax=Aureispira anguillae TaxID=2864201 RepID=A0A915YBX9_9BACT|nr:hypothetical protein [Aureispira anguillae]BDS10260.1 hypothetical protein AsAng_0009680 [Aureispira anguillae]